MGVNKQEETGSIKYLRLLLKYLHQEDDRLEWEKDIWYLEKIGFEVRQNLIALIKNVTFAGIEQSAIKEEIKRASYIRIKYLSVGSLVEEIRAAKHFVALIYEKHPEIESLGSVKRIDIEDYLTYVNLERGQERNLKTEIAG